MIKKCNGKFSITGYFKSLVNSGTKDSSRSFSLVLSAIIGALIGLTICFCLIYDTCNNGYIETDLNDLAWFLLSTGCFMFGGGINEVLADRNDKKYSGKEGNCNNNTTIGNKKDKEAF